jgi:hypothetical protein
MAAGLLARLDTMLQPGRLKRASASMTGKRKRSSAEGDGVAKGNPFTPTHMQS